MRRLLQVLAQAGNPDNLVNLPHLEVKVRIATSPGLEETVVRETIDAVKGPVLPMLNEQGVNVSYIQLTDTGLVREPWPKCVCPISSCGWHWAY